MYGEYKPLAAIRDQQVDIIDETTSVKLCTVKAGPKTAIHALKDEISTACGIPAKELLLKYGDHKFKDIDHVGIHVFKDLTAGASAVLTFIRLTAQEAEEEDGRQKALEKVKHGEKLSHLDELYRGDPEIALMAVELDNASALQHASDSVKADRETMLEALKISTSCMYYVAESLWNDRQFMIGAVSIEGTLLGAKMVPQSWCSDAEVVMYACEQDGFSLKLASEELRANRGVVIAAVNQRGTALMYASQELRSDYYVVLDAVRNNRMAIVHAMNGLREDDEIRAAAGKGPADSSWQDKEKVELIKAKFHELDANGDGFLDYSELQNLLKQGNPDMEDDEIQLLYDEMNVHHDGRVDFHEFCDWIFRETAGDEAEDD